MQLSCPVTRHQGEETSTSLSTPPPQETAGSSLFSPNQTKPNSFTTSHMMPSSLFIICSDLKLYHDLVKGGDCPALPCMVQSHLESHVRFGVSQYRKDVKLLERIQSRTKMVLLLNIFKNPFLRYIRPS